MKTRFLFFFLCVPIFTQEQTLIKCNDSVSFFVEQKSNFYFSIKLLGSTTTTENSKVINFQNSPIQILCVDTKDYITNGSKESTILSTYIMSETEYYTGLFKQKLDLQVYPIKLNENKLAALWFFDMPEEVQKSSGDNASPAIKMVSISIIFQNYLLSIGTNQFKDENFENIKQLLINLIKSSTAGSGEIKDVDFCK